MTTSRILRNHIITPETNTQAFSLRTPQLSYDVSYVNFQTVVTNFSLQLIKFTTMSTIKCLTAPSDTQTAWVKNVFTRKITTNDITHIQYIHYVSIKLANLEFSERRIGDNQSLRT